MENRKKLLDYSHHLLSLGLNLQHTAGFLPGRCWFLQAHQGLFSLFIFLTIYHLSLLNEKFLDFIFMSHFPYCFFKRKFLTVKYDYSITIMRKAIIQNKLTYYKVGFLFNSHFKYNDQLTLDKAIHICSINFFFFFFLQIEFKGNLILVNTFIFYFVIIVGFVFLRNGCSVVIYLYVTGFKISYFIVLFLLFIKISVPVCLEKYVF